MPELVETKPARKAGPFEFVAAWQRASGVCEVARQFGITESSARSRASHYRGRGVRLKTMGAPGGRDTRGKPLA